MYEKQAKSWIKHIDFMIVDVLCMQLCFCLSYWMNEELANPYGTDRFLYQAVVLLVCQLIILAFTNSYKNVLRRGPAAELLALIKYTLYVFVLMLVYLFLAHLTDTASRMQLGFTFVFFLVFAYAFRMLNKWRIFHFGKEGKKSLVVVTSQRLAPSILANLSDPKVFNEYFVSRVILLDADELPLDANISYDVPVERVGAESVGSMSHEWVDEVFIMQPEDIVLPTHLLDDLLEMGMTVSYATAAMGEERWPVTDVRKLGNYRVLTSSIRMASIGQLAVKRVLDIVGSLVGIVLMCIAFVFVAPAIYAKSPGPIFFKQKRVGRNGKVFTMYKFRSMYLDAEERKDELRDRNKIADGMMFKVTDDPRIIGSEKKDKDGNPKGIGTFIRRTTIDELPQFINVLQGNMSLVGTRPPTLDEWEKYDLGHRARMSIKPGITGLWQVSGRSKITDFRKVVRLDREYIENWNIWLDIKILVKTVIVVFKRIGAE